MNRRHVLIGALVAALAAGAIAGGVVLASGGKNASAAPPQSTQTAQTATVNMHPVAGNFKPDKTKLSDCSTEGCYEQAFGDVAYYQGPKAALALFAHEMATNKAIDAGCHPIAHYIGAGTLARNHGNIPKSFAAGSSICWSGFYHGILERAFYGISTETGLIKAARRVCSDPSLQRNEFLFYQCVHGLGHGLMISTGYDLPYALHVCEKLQTSWDQSSCTGGVYMENVNAANGTSIGFKTTWVKPNDLVYPCDSPVTKGHRLYCYLMVTSRILGANGFNWAATAKICSHVQKIWIATCFQSFGRDADGSTSENGPRDLQLCQIAGRWAGECIYGVVRDMTAYFAGVKQSSALCAIAAAADKGYCYQGIGTIVGTLKADTAGRRADCTAASPSRFLDACLRGAGVPVSA
ncbi:MAG TPA: hypothetical protein VLJ76_07520 [Gaiellaceae bacterium]|nr:hypothetical protein [Gaiellaceae bacterium]